VGESRDRVPHVRRLHIRIREPSAEFLECMRCAAAFWFDDLARGDVVSALALRNRREIPRPDGFEPPTTWCTYDESRIAAQSS
jgi:hypothetical protein